MDQVLYELEDFLGGHSAVSNLLVRALIEIAAVPGLSQKVYKEVINIWELPKKGRRNPSSNFFQCIQDRNTNYMQALIHETLRKSSSPIVPHVASVDSSIDGNYFLNNYTVK